MYLVSPQLLIQSEKRFRLDLNSQPLLRRKQGSATPLTEPLPYHMIHQFSIPQKEHPLGGSSKKGNHVYFLLIVAKGATIVMSDCTIVTSGHHGSITTFISNKSII